MPNHRGQTKFIMSIDKSREYDLEELTKAIEKARTPGERDYYKRIMYRIFNESDNIRYWREELLRAIRSNSRDRKSYCIAKIQYIRANETAGHSWGNNKAERAIN